MSICHPLQFISDSLHCRCYACCWDWMTDWMEYGTLSDDDRPVYNGFGGGATGGSLAGSHSIGSSSRIDVYGGFYAEDPVDLVNRCEGK